MVDPLSPGPGISMTTTIAPGGVIVGATGIMGPTPTPAGMQPPQPPSMTATSHVLIQCRNSKCNNACPIEEAQRLYKTCKNCHTYYCSRECRKAHKPKHQKHCMQLRASSLLTDLMHQIRLAQVRVSPIWTKHHILRYVYQMENTIFQVKYTLRRYPHLGVANCFLFRFSSVFLIRNRTFI